MKESVFSGNFGNAREHRKEIHRGGRGGGTGQAPSTASVKVPSRYSRFRSKANSESRRAPVSKIRPLAATRSDQASTHSRPDAVLATLASSPPHVRVVLSCCDVRLCRRNRGEMDYFVILVCLISSVVVICGNIPPKRLLKPTAPALKEPVLVQKCCEEWELMVDGKCRPGNETDDTQLWKPMFTDEFGSTNLQVPFNLSIGIPDCGTRQQWPIHHYTNSEDRLILLPDGKLRHYIVEPKKAGDYGETDDVTQERIPGKGPEHIADLSFYDYHHGQYCLDKILYTESAESPVEAQFAIVCTPESEMAKTWQNTDFVFRRVLNPVFHTIAMVCFLIVAIVHFVFPQLRDLVGNIITTISVCFFVSNAAEVVKIFTEFHNELSYLVADALGYFSLLGAFFWLNGLGYYIWKTFRSRNVFLRITDGRKYCYYSIYVWGSTITMAAVAIFAHLMLDTEQNTDSLAPSAFPAGAIRWLGIAVFFMPIACTILVNIFFYVSTAQIINRMRTYGRIHHKMKYNFQTFIKMFLVMTIGWIFMILSWMHNNLLSYLYIIMGLLHALSIFYISIVSPKKVRFLLRKACCYEKCIFPCCRPGDDAQTTDWGEEMMAMNVSPY